MSKTAPSSSAAKVAVSGRTAQTTARPNHATPGVTPYSAVNLTVTEMQRVADSSRLTYKAGPMTRPVARSHMQSSGTLNGSSLHATTDTRNFLRDAEVLRKELERKDQRNAALSSEMGTLRTSYSSLQRELRMLSGSFEKVNADRQRLAHELVKTKEYKDRLEAQLARMNDAHHATQQVCAVTTMHSHSDRRDWLFIASLCEYALVR